MFIFLKAINIKQFFIGLFLVGILVPIVLLGALGAFISSNTLTNELSLANKEHVSVIARSVERYIREPLEDLKIVETILHAHNDSITQQLKESIGFIIGAHSHLLGLQIANDTGTTEYFYPEDSVMIGIDVSGHDYYKKGISQNKPYWSSSFMSDQLNVVSTTLSKKHDSKLITLFISLQEIEVLSAAVAHEKFEHRYIAITDQRGVFISHNNKEKVRLREYDPHFIDSKNRWNGNILESILPYDGIDQMVYSLFLPSTHWKVSVYQPVKQTTAPIYEMLKWLIIATFVIGAVALIIAHQSSSLITRSLKVLTQNSEAISHGVYQTIKTPIFFNEFSKLAHTMNQMSSDIKSRESALHSSKSMIKSVIDSMPSMLIALDSNLCVTHWNRSTIEVTGLAYNDAYGRLLFELIPRLKYIETNILEVITSLKEISIPKQLYMHNNQTDYEDITIYPHVNQGISGVVIRIDNVSEHVKMEEVVVQNEKMLSVGGLAAGMAHEINNPLGGILQNAENIINRLTNSELKANVAAAEKAGLSFSALQTYMDLRNIPRMFYLLKDAGNRATSIVHNMLSFARKDSDRFSTHNITELLESVIEIASTDYDLKKSIDIKSISIVRNYEDNLPEVPCEASKIQQVLFNIIQNGAEAMTTHHTKIVEKGEKPLPPEFTFTLKRSEDQASVVISILDNGPGMSDEVSKRIFEPFFTTKSVGVGTGLGLSVSYFIITENHGGTLHIEPCLNHGAHFVISLPINRTLKNNGPHSMSSLS
ncbi:MAG: ATP-binding protein [Fibrobacterales bacterium]